jgi:hypothetical protein
VTAPGGASSGLTWSSRSDRVARHTSQQGNPSCLDSKATTATSVSTIGTGPSAAVDNRYGDARGAARGVVLAHAGLPSKAAETEVDKATSGLARPLARDLSLSLLVGGGGGGRRLARAGRRRAWGLMPASSAGVSIQALHLTGTGRLWKVWLRLLLLRSGGQVGHHSRRS